MNNTIISESAHSLTSQKTSVYKMILSILMCAVTVAVCILPMGKLPLWNGEQPDHRNQYELMAEAILDGHIDFNYGDEDSLSQLENPYDPVARKEAKVKYHWDHAYYNGHYYMYFGIVPVLLVFLPYRVLTGTSLTTYHATQIFVAFAIIGIFVLFDLLSKLFFNKLNYGVRLSLSVAFSVMSVWYSAAEPALYCTAITSAIALEVWSLYFFIRAVWGEQKENRQILFAGIGALSGALAFGCRPPIALANILVLPMLIVFLKQRKFTPKLFGKLFLAALPYFAVAIGLMVYNYVRFENPFEFGQAYQLTVADQSQYKITLDFKTVTRILKGLAQNFLGIGNISGEFPYIKAGGVFFNFPILLLCFGMISPSVLKNMKKSKILMLVIGLFLTVLIITAADVMWTPYLLERYRMDIYFLMGIGCFTVVGMMSNSCDEKIRPYLNCAAVIMSVVTVISSVLLCVNTIGNYYSDKVSEIADALNLM